MVEMCPHYYGSKVIGGKDPIVQEDRERVICPEILSIERNFPSRFSGDYRARFCCKDFAKCEYKKLKDAMIDAGK
jgi:hypothetical protein